MLSRSACPRSHHHQAIRWSARHAWHGPLGLALLLGGLAALAFDARPASAIDFSVDVRQQEAVLGEAAAEEPEGAPLDGSLFNEIPEFPMGFGSSDEVDTGGVPTNPSQVNGSSENAMDMPPLPQGFQPRIYQTDKFPVPQCLDANVRFWKQIYRDVETTEGLIHDREDLSRVFGRFTLPTDRRRRKAEITRQYGFYQARLQRLAGQLARIERGENPGVLLDAADRQLLGIFRPEDRRADRIFEVSGRLRIQSGLRSRFDGGVRRSIDLLPTITPILDSAGVPKDIVHLPHVESSYVRTARSKVGAVGLWQIMPATMRILMGPAAVGRRMDPVVSTRAAAKLLAQNYRILGSWPLALTAYNHGTAGVSRGVRATGSRDLCTIIERYQSRSFRFASSNFYAQFLAARHVALDKYRELSVSSSHRKVLRPLLAHALREKSSED